MWLQAAEPMLLLPHAESSLSKCLNKTKTQGHSNELDLHVLVCGGTLRQGKVATRAIRTLGAAHSQNTFGCLLACMWEGEFCALGLIKLLEFSRNRCGISYVGTKILHNEATVSYSGAHSLFLTLHSTVSHLQTL